MRKKKILFVCYDRIALHRQLSLTVLAEIKNDIHVTDGPGPLRISIIWTSHIHDIRFTYSLRSCSRRRSDLFIRLFFTSFLRFIQYFVFFRPFTTELQYRLHTLVTYRTRYFRTLNPTWRTVRTCSCPISMPDLQYAFDISYVPYEIIDLNSQSIKVHH